MKAEEQRIGISLDCLLDTRIGSVARIDPAWPKRLLGHGNGWYWRRVVDDFDKVLGAMTTAAVKTKYRERNVATLAASFETNMIYELRKIITKMDAAIGTDPAVKGSEITVNFWPYEMSDASADNLLALIKSRIMLTDDDGDPVTDFNIQRVFIPLEDLTIKTIREHWDVYFLYDFHDWHDIHGPKLEEGKRAPRVQLVIPALFRDKEPDQDSLRMTDGSLVNPWDLLVSSYAQYIRIMPWPVSAFSIFKVECQL